MTIKTRAMVISSISYGDHSKILRLYTQTSGIKSFIIKGIHTKKNKIQSLIFPLNQVEIIFEDRGNELNYLQSIQSHIYYQTISQNPIKATMVMFISEILNAVLKEEESNPKMYLFLEKSMISLDEKMDFYSDFHLWFLLQLSSHLGFYPHVEMDYPYFDLTSGSSSQSEISGIELRDQRLDLLKELIGLNFPNQNKNQFNQAQRKEILEILINYYELQLSAFKRPKSLEILQEVFA